MILALSGFLSVLLSILVFIIVIGTIILIHEFGHFIFARRAGILCHEFSIGMGPVIYQKKKGETTYSVRAIPIGGFVAMAGEANSNDILKTNQKIGLKLDESNKVTHIVIMDNNDSNVYGNVVKYDLYGEHGEELYITLNVDGVEKTFFVNKDAFYVFSKKQQLQITPYERSFESKTLWQRFITLFAGAGMNFVLAIVVYFIYWCAVGVPNLGSNVLGTVSTGYYGAEYLQVEDAITSVNGVKVNTWEEFSIEMDKLEEEYATSVDITVLRNGTEIEYNIPLTIIINSCGLNNVGLIDTKFEYVVDGAMMGSTSAMNYISDTKTNEVLMTIGDIINAIRVDSITITKEKGLFK